MTLEVNTLLFIEIIGGTGGGGGGGQFVVDTLGTAFISSSLTVTGCI